MSKLGVALLGLDHWYAALGLAAHAARNDAFQLVAVAHDDAQKAEQTAQEHGAVLATTDYAAVLERKDVQIVVAQYSTDRNVAVCRAAAEAGKHIISVKPMALDLAGADAIAAAVRAAGVTYLPFESLYRLAPEWQRIKQWLDEGRIGRPLRLLQSMHAGLPQAWPGSAESGWWVDPARVPGGGWLDHAIYAVDLARWLFGAEVREVRGAVANQRHPDLAVEDYGCATCTLSSGAVALIEDTWTAERGFFFNRSEIVGSAGAILDDTRAGGRLSLRGDFGFEGWVAVEPRPAASGALLDHMAACLRGEAAPAAGAEDGRANLAACLAFYQAARGGGAVRPG